VGKSLMVEIARQMTKNLRRSVAELRAIARDRAGAPRSAIKQSAGSFRGHLTVMPGWHSTAL
jgi:hypothetical protein